MQILTTCALIGRAGYYDGIAVLTARATLKSNKDKPIPQEIELGLEQIPEEPCLFSNGRIIVFFYVDDIVILARKRTRRRWRIIRQNSRQNMK